MGDVFSKVISILLCVWLMFLWPLYQAEEESKQMERLYLYQQTVEFVDGIRNTGEIREEDFRHFQERIARMNHRYQAEFTGKEASGQEEEFYAGTFYTKDLENYFHAEKIYMLSYNDFVKVVITDEEENMVVCYGGGVKASQEEGEDAYETY